MLYEIVQFNTVWGFVFQDSILALSRAFGDSAYKANNNLAATEQKVFFVGSLLKRTLTVRFCVGNLCARLQPNILLKRSVHAPSVRWNF